jgi:hypothetical protein
MEHNVKSISAGSSGASRPWGTRIVVEFDAVKSLLAGKFSLGFARNTWVRVFDGVKQGCLPLPPV